MLVQSPHERYASSLLHAGLDETALGRAWFEMSEHVLESAVAITLPFSETGFFADNEALAAAYRFEGRRGQRLVVELSQDRSLGPELFVDLFEVRGDTARFRRVESIPRADSTMEHVLRDANYVLRIQPELLRSGQYTITMRSAASIAFPVADRDTRAIRSVFGDPRDGGRRRHEGVDIFAPHGTPVLSATSGIATTRENRLGGKTVWVRGVLGGHSFYYAHLDTQFVRNGTRVNAGDTLGLVGNTGNARYTPPHLHFGIYARGEGAVDPFPFLYEPTTSPPAVAVDLNQMGTTLRTTAANLHLRSGPDTRTNARATLERHTPVRIHGGSGSWYRVTIPDGSVGYIAAGYTQPISSPIEQRSAVRSDAVLTRPGARAAVMDSISAGRRVLVLARYGGYDLVETPSGRHGWITAP